MRWILLPVLAAWLVFLGPARAEVMVYVPGSMTEAMEEVAVVAARAGLAFKEVDGHSPAQARQIAP